jgi:DNA-binding MarR family transcriptional regulator
VVELTLTDQGKELTRLIPHHLASVYNNHLAGFSQDEFTQLKQMLRRIISNRDISV